MQQMLGRLYNLTDKALFRGLSLCAALLIAGCILWNPTRIALSPGIHNTLWGLALIWAVCSGVIHGSGFVIRSTLWKVVFNPLTAWIILLAALLRYFVF